MTSTQQYLIVTPTKNEEKNILRLIRLIERQTIKPILWVIVDESTDNTVKHIKELTEKYDWVKSIFWEKSGGYLGINYGIACKTGFDFAIEYCKLHKMEYDYIGLIDADVDMDEDFFERLMNEFEKDLELGIASGIEQWKISGRLVDVNMREDLPMGPARMWRRKCFAETGGYQDTAAPDSVSNVKAKLHGWKTKQFKGVIVITRKASTARGYWQGLIQRGKDSYFLNYHPLIIILKTVKYSCKRPYYTGFGFFLGYFGCVISKKKKIEDAEILYYFKYTRPKEIFRHYLDMLKNKLKR